MLRHMLGGMAFLCLAATATGAAAASTTWTLDSLSRIGGLRPEVEGHPKLIHSSQGRALAFDGKADAIFMPVHPLAGASTYTIEAIFRPEGGAFEQRWLHLGEDPKPGAPVSPASDPSSRFLMEIRVVGNKWYLDAFTASRAAKVVLAFPEKLHPIGPWYQVAQVYDGKTLRSYVNGKLQGQAPQPAFVPHGPGRTSIGVRLNRVNYFHGAVHQLRFTPKALRPDQFLKLKP